MMLLVFFVFKQKTAYERRISDWSSDVCSSDRLQRLYDGLQSHFSLEKRYVRSDGNVVWAVLDVALVRYAGGAPDHYVVQVRDSTDDRLTSELMAHRAMHDPLTGLANRTLMQDVLQRVLEQPDATQRVGVIAV